MRPCVPHMIKRELTATRIWHTKAIYLTLMDALDTSVLILQLTKVVRWRIHVCWSLPLPPIAMIPLNWVRFSVPRNVWAGCEQGFAFIVGTGNVGHLLHFGSLAALGVTRLPSRWSHGNCYTSYGCCAHKQGLLYKLSILIDVRQLRSRPLAMTIYNSEQPV
jgi:hypothetical protein